MTAQELRAWREARGWTQAKAAKWWGCREVTWWRYEKGDRAVPAPLAKRAHNEIKEK